MEKISIYQKLQKARVTLQEMNLKKSGKNKYAGFTYYELGDFLPAINEICNKIGLCPIINFDDQYATMKIYDCDNADIYIEFTSPMKEIEQKGCNPIQSLGGVETYSRRYLYLTAFEIVENDFYDGISGSETKEKNNNVSRETLIKINKSIDKYATLTNKTPEEVLAVMCDRYHITSIENISEIVGKTIYKQLNNWIVSRETILEN